MKKTENAFIYDRQYDRTGTCFHGRGLCENIDDECGRSRGFVFVGEKKEQKEFKANIPGCDPESSELADEQNKNYCFGASAFRGWADEIESGRYDHMKPEGI